MRPRSLAALFLLAALTPSTAGAAAQTYTVVQCHPLNRARANAILEDAPPYAARSFCGDPQNDYAIKVTSTRYSRHGGYGRVRWTTGSSALGIVSVDLRAKTAATSPFITLSGTAISVLC